MIVLVKDRTTLTILFAVALSFVLAAAVYFISRPGALDFAELRGDRPFNVVVVTLDTTRADRLGSYGRAQASTPTLDALAAGGVLFRRAYSVTPLTLPSHTSLFSGAYPPYHGVRDNGGFIVPEELTTLAEVLAGGGYDTGAFVAAYVLDSRWGLDQGFDTYHDEFDVRGQRFISMGSVQRPADEVVDAALGWLEGRGDEPFFLWVHLYDPHAPYEPPEPYRTRFASAPYQGEIAFMDSEVGRLLDGLDASGDGDDTFVVVAGDHGESLGEHGEVQHGFFIYESATHVPLIISTPFEEFGGIERDEVVSLIDVMPTILDMAGFETPEAVQGESLTPLFRADASANSKYVYAESFYARFHYGWSDLTSIQDERYKLIMSPDPELYDLAEDPGETTNLVDQENDLYRRLAAAAEEFVSRIGESSAQTEFMAVDEDTLAKLASLGYLGSFSSATDAEVMASPRGKIGIYNKSIRARELMHREDYEDAERILLEILDEDPQVLDAHQSLGQLYTLQERFDEAVEVFRRAIPLKPEDPSGYINLADAQLKIGLVEEAEQTVVDSFSFTEPNGYLLYLLGNINLGQEDYDEAIEAFEDCLGVNPESSAAQAGLAAAYFDLGRIDLAGRNARAALEMNDQVPGANFTLARVHEARGEIPEAVQTYLREIEISPDDTGSHFNLAMIYRVAGQSVQEEQYLARTLEINPEAPRALLFMARIYLNRGQDLERAVQMVTTAVDAELETQELALGYFLLADLHNRLGDPARAREYALKARSLAGR